MAKTNCRVLMKPFDLRTLASISDDIASGPSTRDATAHQLIADARS